MSRVQHANSFDFARLFGSLLVLYSHAFALAGVPEPWIGGVGGLGSFGSLGVYIFSANGVPPTLL
jgi:peptidoglycan/LPS O-acetylase OafA/YrhL